jgi:hypothetical protein
VKSKGLPSNGSIGGLPALKKDVNPFLFSARIGILPEGNEVDFAVDDKAFDKARFTRKICRERIPGQILCVLCDLCGKDILPC